MCVASTLKRGWHGIVIALLAVSLAACGGSNADNARSPVAGPAAAVWRTFDNADGTRTDIPARPVRILSTSVAITGTLLAIDAPVVASASNARRQFFAQWAQFAQDRQIEDVWPAGGVDLEAAYAVRPDLIVVAVSGNDSAMPQLAELRKVAPTIVLDYGDQTWQDLAIKLGHATGQEVQAEARIAAFEEDVARARARIRAPAGKTSLISFNGAGMGNPIATRASAHGRLLGALGFDIEEPDPSWQTNAGQRKDFIWAPYENLGRLTAQTTFLLSVDQAGTHTFLSDPMLANLPSVRAHQVYGLGRNSFRIDYYSATEIVDDLVRTFGQ